MTNKEAIEQLKQIPIHDGVSDNYMKTIYEALDMAIEALEQQPCDDCISRQEAINCVTLNEFRYKIVEDIKTLPSVTPKEKTGRWIEGGYEDMYYVCSECDYKASEYWHKPSYKYCPNCGARMVSE